jgi:hypothetical protein
VQVEALRPSPAEPRRPASALAPRTAQVATDDALGREVRALAAANDALAAGDPARALLLVAHFKHEFPSGALLPDALALEIDAAHAAGDEARVAALGAAYLERYPNTSHSARVRRLIGAWTGRPHSRGEAPSNL